MELKQMDNRQLVTELIRKDSERAQLVKEVAEEVWQDANTSFAGKSTRYSIFFDDKIHLLVGETNKGWYNIHIAIDNSKAKCKDSETIQYGERI